MLFCTWTYVFFLIIVALLYWRLPHKCRIPLLLLASYIFYMAWSPPFGLMYAPVIFLDSLYFYGLGKAMLRWPNYKKPILIFGIVTELSLLGYFKYSNFIYQNIEAVARMVNLPIPHLEFNLFMPLAISFTNFILISYLVDVYRGQETMKHSFIRFATYVAFFPHLIAGPIVRAKELLHQFDNYPRFDIDRLVRGIHLFMLGLGLKIFVADVLAPYVNVIFANPSLQGFDTTWVATYSFAVQLFCDFFGYTLMAQGSALALGYTLPDNFNAPFFAQNISEFWRRWHMSLTRWLRDYVYMSLCGSRKSRGGERLSKWRSNLNMFITMVICGLWHGANWNFIAFGAYNGLLICLYNMAVYFKLNQNIPRLLAIFLTFHLFCFSGVMFRATSLPEGFKFISAMLNPFVTKGLLYNINGTISQNVQIFNGINALTVVILFFAIHALIRNYGKLFTQPLVRDWAYGCCYVVFIFLGLTVDTSQQQFIYFQF